MLNTAEQTLAVMIQQVWAVAGCATGPHRLGSLRLSTQARFDTALQLSAQLAAISTEDLDAVVFWWVVTCRNHQPTRSLEATDQPRNRRSWTETERPDLTACSGKTCGQSSHHHRTAAAGVHPDQNGTSLGQNTSTPEANLQCQRGSDRRTDTATQTICPETDLGRLQGTERMNGGRGHEVSFVD